MTLARRLRAAAVDSLSIQAFLTRDGDTEVPLDERAAIANNFNADIFISLHANGSRIASRILSATCSARSVAQAAHSRMPNSSPPSRASVSRQRTLDLSSAPTCPSSASPAL